MVPPLPVPIYIREEVVERSGRIACLIRFIVVVETSAALWRRSQKQNA
jgi:hypothetical protein